MSFSLLRRSAFAPASALRAFSTTAPRPMAKITIIGNLAAEPEVAELTNGREVVRYSLASNTGGRDNRKTSWFRITSFQEGPQRDFLLGLQKGSMLYVEGEAVMTTTKDPTTGVSKTNLNVTQRVIELLKRGGQQNQEQATFNEDE
ncbi:hypothetical protein G7046_g6410 [Stylonectria norvegica]|nr:hypothetical protein G7046_g6410 [Stylonectria norvegica]